MNRIRLAFTAIALVAAAPLGLSLAACHASGGAQVSASTPPPPPAPTPPPPPDKDGDGIADAQDACPDKPGVANADAAKNGCPEEPAVAAVEKKVTIEGNDVKITEKIMFDVGKATIKPESNALLDEIATVVKTAGTIDLIEVGGHADVQGDEKQNLKLTDERAKAVVDALVARGVPAGKLRAKGYGQYCPMDPGSTPEAYEHNRRVEFKILKMGGKPTGVALGCDAAVKKGVKPQPVL